MDYASEVQSKLERVRTLMSERGVDALWLRRVDSVAWITGGLDAAVNTADTAGVASVLVTFTNARVLTNTIEAPRVTGQDDIEARGFAVDAVPWHQDRAVPEAGLLGVDMPLPGALDLSADLFRLRAHLLPVEQDRIRALSAQCASAMHRAINRVKPGQSEHEIAAALSDETRREGANPIVVLIATDERIFRYRHPLPTAKTLDKYAMLVLCGRKDGLVCSVTRLVHFGPLSDELRAKQAACAKVDAYMLAASQPGATMAGIFQVLQDAYARAGYDGEWKLHHQGGIAGYAAREVIATPADPTSLESGMICAWNPSITGVKSEDTILVTEAASAPEVLTAIAGWPVTTIDINGLAITRPLVLEIT